MSVSAFRDQALSVISRPAPQTMDEATMHVPARRAGDRPPAIPKLMRPRQSLAIARRSDLSSALPSPPQIVRVCLPLAMRASNASPATPITADNLASHDEHHRAP